MKNHGNRQYPAQSPGAPRWTACAITRSIFITLIRNLTPIPDQAGSSYTYQDLVDALKGGANVNIKGDVGKRPAYSMGADLNLCGSGRPEPAGRVDT
jgi:hypothetical protein